VFELAGSSRRGCSWIVAGVTPTVSLRKKTADQKTATLELANWFALISLTFFFFFSFFFFSFFCSKLKPTRMGVHRTTAR
jgi:uncharacterized membrane protein HdeD (DUF308 family)